MKPAELIALCDDAIERHRTGEQITDHPTIMLVVPIKSLPRRDHVRLLGRVGPLGWVARIKQEDGGLTAVAYFPAVAVKACIQQQLATA